MTLRPDDITDPRVVKALAHPVRVQVLSMLEGRVASPNELSRELGVSLGTLSYHIHRLVDLGFVKLVRRIPRRGAIEHYYTGVIRPRIADPVWAEVPPIVKRAMIGAAIETVARHVNAAAETGGFDVADAHLTRNSVSVDDEGWHQIARELDAFIDRVHLIAAQSAGRLAPAGKDASDAIDASVALMLFRSAPVGTPAPDVSHSTVHRRRRPPVRV